MNNKDGNIASVMNISFDMIMGPVLSWKKDFSPDPALNLDYEQFAMSTYLAFKGGNSNNMLQPKAIVYDSFSVVGFTRGHDLLCLFLKNHEMLSDIARLRNFAEEIASQVENDDNTSKVESAADDDEDEIKRIIKNVLNDTEMTTPELRRCFKLSSSGIWKIMSELENNGVVKRAGKKGKAISWTLA
ncbi:MAG: hypothetical protein ACTSVI_16840 [Promethearchaeota archaeon]